MTKTEILEVIKLLSAMESAMFTAKVHIPDHLIEQLNNCMLYLEKEILK